MAPVQNLSSLYKLNLMSIGITGVLVCWQLYYFTGWLEAFTGLLALGGIFSWVAFVAKVLPEERLKGLQIWVDHILEQSKAWRWAALIAIGALAAAAFSGTIEVQALHDGGSVHVHDASTPEEKDPDWRLLPPGGSLRFPTWTLPWAPTAVLVKARGLPELPVTVHPLSREVLRMPDSFRRPVVLLRPTLSVAQALHSRPVTLVVRYGKDERKIDFHGQAVWINCSDETEVPPDMINDWRAEVGGPNARVPEEWVYPQSLEQPTWKFEVGQQLDFELRDKQNNMYACTASYRVRALPQRADGRQVGVLHADNSTDPKCGAKFSLSISPR